MMGLFELLAALIQYLVAWVPRPFLVPPTHAYVRWTLGREGYLVKRWGLYIPLIHSREEIEMRADALECEPKVLWTRDGKTVAVGMALVWHISDPLLVAGKINGLDAFVSKLAESVLPEFVGTYNLDEFKKRCAGKGDKPGEWGANALLRGRLRTRFESYGIEIDDAFVNFTDDRIRSLKIIGSGNEKGSTFVIPE